jgi:hypothetical protein
MPLMSIFPAIKSKSLEEKPMNISEIAELKREVSNIDHIADLRYEGVLERIQLIEEDVEDLMEDVANQGI